MARLWQRLAGNRGLTLMESMVALSMIGLVTLVVFQIQILGIRQTAKNFAGADVNRAVRQSLIWLPDDLLYGRSAGVSAGVLSIEMVVEGNDRTVDYALEGDQLVRVLRDGGGAILQRHTVAHGVTHFLASYDADTALAYYELRAEGRRANPFEIFGYVYLRNANVQP